MNRITGKMLENQINYLNKITNSPTEPWQEGQSSVGNYHLDCAYGGYALHRIMNHSGGVTNISQNGYTPKRELFNWISAYVQGYNTALEAKKKEAQND